MSSNAPAGRSQRGPALARCVGDVDRFLEEHWNQRFHLHPGDDADDLLSLDDVDEILTQTSPRAPAFRLVRNGQTLPRSSYTRPGTQGGQRLSDLPDVGRVFQLFDDGATIALQGLHRYWAPVTRFCRELETFLSHPVQANAYVTPPGARGLNVHHDTHDVFALQTFGRKHWVVHEPAVEVPLASQGWSSDEHEPGPLVLETDLTPGDCLYLPRGTPHAAETRGSASVHLTIGIRTIRWHDVITAALEDAGEQRDFRDALPVGFANDPRALAPDLETVLKQAAAWLAAQDADELAERAADRFWRSRQPPLAGQLRQLLELDAVGADTVVRRRQHVVARLRADDDVELLLGDRTVRLPLVTADAVRDLLSGRRLRVGDIDTTLALESRLVLVRRLIREGVLVAEPAADE
ncbi:MAG: cupin domain-containing protein [Nitriliruptorales bacterium]|nr:cupin domain-containing protein [Nitriliruptorales bacterium]